MLVVDDAFECERYSQRSRYRHRTIVDAIVVMIAVCNDREMHRSMIQVFAQIHIVQPKLVILTKLYHIHTSLFVRIPR